MVMYSAVDMRKKIYQAYFNDMDRLKSVMGSQLEDYYSQLYRATWDYDTGITWDCEGAHPHSAQKKVRKKPSKPRPEKPKRKPISRRMSILEF